MPAFILLGWIIGLALGGVAIAMGLLSLGFPLPALLTSLAGPLAPLLSILSPLVAFLFSILVLVLFYAAAYAIATAAIAPLLPGLTGLAPPIFPLAVSVTSGAAPVAVPATVGEFFGRGMMIGLSASTNSILLSLIPVAGLFLAPWAFTVISLSAVIFIARNRIFHGFLGWSAWLFPISHIATIVGSLLFLINIPFALIMFGPAAFSFDWTTGVVHTAGGLATTATSAGGFSLGNFNFARALPAAGAFTASSVESHETGHTLNTAAFGGIVLWINAIDQNIVPPRRNLAYGELAAESHAQNFGAGRNRFFIRLWA